MITLLFFLAATLFLEHADTPEKRERGLMDRCELKAGHGMLFHFERECYPLFWSLNCNFPLSLAFIDERGRVVDIQNLEAYPGRFPQGESEEKRRFFLERAVIPKKQARYVLEVPKGWFKANGVNIGDQFSWEKERGFFSKES